MKIKTIVGGLALSLTVAAPAWAAPVYLNIDNITVSVGPNTTGSPNNTYDLGYGIEKVIDAPSADASELHSQESHIWYTSPIGGGLELLFDFGLEYNISTLHFWNYNAEAYDVDNIDFTFYNEMNNLVGSLTVQPDLGDPGNIFAQDITLAAPLNVRYVTAFLTGTNGQVDFQNMGFTAEVSDPVTVPEPATLGLLALALAMLKGRRLV